jgi:hypothetical protein
MNGLNHKSTDYPTLSAVALSSREDHKRMHWQAVFALLLAFIVLLCSTNTFAQKISQGTGGLWSSTSTWGGSIPTSGDDVTINTGTTVTADFTNTSIAACSCKSITIIGTLVNNTIGSGGTLAVYGNWDNSLGVYTPGTRSVTFYASSPSTILAGGTGVGKAFWTVIQASGTVSQLDDIKVDGNWNLSGGTWNVNTHDVYVTRNITIQSSATFMPTANTVYMQGGPNASLEMYGDNYFRGLVIDKSPNTATLGNNIQVNSQLTITSGSTLDVGGNYYVHLEGGWQNNGTFVHGTGSVVCEGAGPQLFNGSTITEFYDLHIENTSGLQTASVNLGQNVKVANTLFLTQGWIKTNSGFKVTMNSGSSISGGSQSSYVDGNLEWMYGLGNVSKNFPVGDNAWYAPIIADFANVSSPGGVTGSTTGSAHPNVNTSGISSSQDVQRFWTLIADGSFGFTGNYNVTPYWVASDQNSFTYSTAYIAKYNAGWSGLQVATSPQTDHCTGTFNGLGDYQVGNQSCTVVASISPSSPSMIYGGNVALIGIPSGGNGPYTHLWSGSGAGYLTPGTGISTPTFSGAPVGTYQLTYTVTDNGGCTASSSVTVSVAPKAIVGSITASNKVYDGNTSATITGRTLSGVIGSDAVSYTGGTATFSDKNVANGKTVTGTGLTLTGADASNYTVNGTATTTANITPLPITGNITASNKVYDGNTSATITSRTLSGVIGSDAVSYTGGTATFSDKNVANGKTVTGTGLTLTGADATNYTVNGTATTTANITPLPITGNFTASNKVYDGNTSATITSRTLTGVIGSDAVSYTGGTATFSDKNVANGKTVTGTGFTLTGTSANNYTVNGTATTTANITPLGITGNITASDKVYDGNTSATITSRTLTGVIGGDAVSYTGGTATFSDPNVGTGKTVTGTGLGLTGSSAGNYTVNSTATTTANITGSQSSYCNGNYLYLAEDDIDVHQITLQDGCIHSNNLVQFENPQSGHHGNVYAVNEIQVGPNVEFWGDVQAPYLNIHNNAVIHGNRSTSAVSNVTLPSFSFSNSSTTDYTVARNGTGSLAPCTRRNVTVQSGGTLTLTAAGIYNFRTLDIQNGAKLVVNVTNGAVEIRLTVDLHFQQNSTISFIPTSTTDVDGSYLLTFNKLGPATVNLENNCRVLGIINAPSAQVHLNNSSRFRGHITAHDVKAENNVTALYHSSSYPLPKASFQQGEEMVAAKQFELQQNYPNPFNPTTTIQYYLPNDQQVTLRVFDFYGREVTTLVNSTQTAGNYTVQFDAKDLPSGTYVCRLESDGVAVSRVMTLMK